jgi:SAM-dependent methyltransferase
LYFAKYLSYFLYLAANWNLRLAAFVIWHEWKGERLYGGQTTGIYNLKKDVPESDRFHASIYQPVNFYTAQRLIATLNTNDKKGTLLDAGCGLGRMFFLAGAAGFRSVYGIDVSPMLCHMAIAQADAAEKRFEHLAVAVECVNAADFEIPDDVSVIFMFNPFDGIIMKALLKQVMRSLKRRPRTLKVLYANPVHKSIWLEAGFEEIYFFSKMKYLEGSTLVYRAPNAKP